MNKEEKKDGWKGFIELCLATKSPKRLSELFDCFFTIEEKQMLKARFLIVQALLQEELTQREIANCHSISVAQITRGSNQLKTISKSLKEFLKKEIS